MNQIVIYKINGKWVVHLNGVQVGESVDLRAAATMANDLRRDNPPSEIRYRWGKPV